RADALRRGAGRAVQEAAPDRFHRRDSEVCFREDSAAAAQGASGLAEKWCQTPFLTAFMDGPALARAERAAQCAPFQERRGSIHGGSGRAIPGAHGPEKAHIARHAPFRRRRVHEGGEKGCQTPFFSLVRRWIEAGEEVSKPRRVRQD